VAKSRQHRGRSSNPNLPNTGLILTAKSKCCVRSEVTETAGKFDMTLLTSNRLQFCHKKAANISATYLSG